MEMDERRHILFDRFLSCLTGVVVAALAWLAGNNCELPPELWDELSVAAGLRPPAREFPIVWQAMMSYVVGKFGINSCVAALKFAGPVSLGIVAAMVSRLFSGYLPRVMKSDMLRTVWGRWIVRVVVLQGALFFALSEPVWLAGRVFSPDMFALMQSLLALLLALWALERASVVCMVFLGAVSALSASEQAISAFVTPAFALYLILKECEPDEKHSALLTNRVIQSVAFRWMGWTFVFCCVIAISANMLFYRASGGLQVSDSGFFAGMVNYLVNCFRYFSATASVFGWGLIIAVAFIPMLIAIGRIRSFADSDRLPPVLGSCLLAVVGILAFLQSSGISECHFWRWSAGAIRSNHMLCLCMFATSLTTVFALCVFVVDIYFRNHGRILKELYTADLEDDYLAERAVHLHRASVRILRPLMLPEPLIALALVIPFKFDTTIREMSSLVNDTISQTAEECGDSTMLFTDGSLDAAVEVAVAARGGKIKAVSMMSGSGKYDIALRTRGVEDDEARTLFSVGAADALRTWVTEENPCASNIALQVGLELWRRNNLPMPQAGGLVSRTAGFPEGDAEKYAERAHGLAERILKLYSGGKPTKTAYPELNKLFLFSQWRLSRMCRMRANEADTRKDSASSEREHALADRLDRLNPEWQKVQERMDWIGQRGGMRLTPKDGLKLGLAKADFKLARSYARKVVVTDEDDVHANFALGMSYFTEKQYGRAEMHLKKCLIRAPDEPAVLNNLAIVQLRLGRYSEAEANALKALTNLPDSAEIKTTIRHIRMARDGKKPE